MVSARSSSSPWHTPLRTEGGCVQLLPNPSQRLLPPGSHRLFLGLFLARAPAWKGSCREPPRASPFYTVLELKLSGGFPYPSPAPTHRCLPALPTPGPLALPMHRWVFLLLPSGCLASTRWMPKVHTSPSQQLQPSGPDPVAGDATWQHPRSPQPSEGGSRSSPAAWGLCWGLWLCLKRDPNTPSLRTPPAD